VGGSSWAYTAERLVGGIVAAAEIRNAVKIVQQENLGKSSDTRWAA